MLTQVALQDHFERTLGPGLLPGANKKYPSLQPVRPATQIALELPLAMVLSHFSRSAVSELFCATCMYPSMPRNV